MNKPDGLTVILPEDAEALILRLPVGEFYGIGPVTATKLQGIGVRTGADLREVSLERLTRDFGSPGAHMYQISRGIDERPVDPSEDRKSIGTEGTYDSGLYTLAQMQAQLPALAERTSKRLIKHDLAGWTVTLKVKFSDFDIVTRQLRLPAPVQAAEQLERVARYLLTPELLEDRAGCCSIHRHSAV